jgi:hypothetical protein
LAIFREIAGLRIDDQELTWDNERIIQAILALYGPHRSAEFLSDSRQIVTTTNPVPAFLTRTVTRFYPK